jgi:hypothetical protein
VFSTVPWTSGRFERDPRGVFGIGFVGAIPGGGGAPRRGLRGRIRLKSGMLTLRSEPRGSAVSTMNAAQPSSRDTDAGRLDARRRDSAWSQLYDAPEAELLFGHRFVASGFALCRLPLPSQRLPQELPDIRPEPCEGRITVRIEQLSAL